MCVYGLGISRQKNINTVNETTKDSNYLLQAIKKNDEFFKGLRSKSVSKEGIVRSDDKQGQASTSHLADEKNEYVESYEKLKELEDAQQQTQIVITPK